MDSLINLCSVPLVIINAAYAKAQKSKGRIRWKNVSILFGGAFLAIFLFRYFNPSTPYFQESPEVAVEDEQYRTALINVLREWPSGVSGSDDWGNIPEEFATSIQSLTTFSNSINKWGLLYETTTRILVVAKSISFRFEHLNDMRFSTIDQTLRSLEPLYQNLLSLQKKIRSRSWFEKYVTYPLFSHNAATYPAILQRNFLTNITFAIDHTLVLIPPLIEDLQYVFEGREIGMLALISKLEEHWPKNALRGRSSETPLQELKAVSARAVKALDDADKTYQELDAMIMVLTRISYAGRERITDRQVDDFVERFGEVRNVLRRVVYGDEMLEVTGVLAGASNWDAALSFDVFGCTVQLSIKRQ